MVRNPEEQKTERPRSPNDQYQKIRKQEHRKVAEDQKKRKQTGNWKARKPKDEKTYTRESKYQIFRKNS